MKGLGPIGDAHKLQIGDEKGVLLANIQSLRMMLRHVTMFLTQILIAMEGYSGIDMASVYTHAFCASVDVVTNDEGNLRRL